MNSYNRHAYIATLAIILKKHLRAFNGFEENGTDSMQELGMDSMQAITILLEIEQFFELPLPEDGIVASVFNTPTTLLDFIVESYKPHMPKARAEVS
jgi:acyl carrier protein